MSAATAIPIPIPWCPPWRLRLLHNALGDNAYVAAMQGAPNDETQFLLDRFGFQAPTLLTNVRTQVRDIDYDRPPTLGTSVPDQPRVGSAARG